MKIPTFFVLMMLSALPMPLAVMPAGASDFTLDIFGNANMDDTIDELDIEYVQGIIDGTNDETELADANYDGTIDEEDIAQINLIIRGEETEITVVSKSPWDEHTAVTVHKPVEKVLTRFFDSAEVLRILDSTDKIIAVGCKNFQENSIFFPELSTLPFVAESRTSELDYEAILSMNPDLFLAWYKEDREKLPGINMGTCSIKYYLMPRYKLS